GERQSRQQTTETSRQYFLCKARQEHWTHGRDHENLRATTTNIMDWERLPTINASRVSLRWISEKDDDALKK
ncbi:MAG TPA: hypothetical protein VES69_02945, partial [Pyrinomonadaceae bacterium]|nr:hypothetical protein [Pyrinomonadaceae bacterium]